MNCNYEGKTNSAPRIFWVHQFWRGVLLLPSFYRQESAEGANAGRESNCARTEVVNMPGCPPVFSASFHHDPSLSPVSGHPPHPSLLFKTHSISGSLMSCSPMTSLPSFSKSLFYFILTSISNIMPTSWGLQLFSGKQHSRMPTRIFFGGVKPWAFICFLNRSLDW